MTDQIATVEAVEATKTEPELLMVSPDIMKSEAEPEPDLWCRYTGKEMSHVWINDVRIRPGECVLAPQHVTEHLLQRSDFDVPSEKDIAAARIEGLTFTHPASQAGR